MTRKIYMLVAYDGTDFHGWQRQPGLRTVQGVLEESLRRVVRHEVDLAGSGRTDAGVHAAGHVGSFVTTCPIPAHRLRHALGSRLPGDVAVLATREAHPDFHATRSALSKLYRYRIHHSRRRPVERRLQRYAYHCWHALDVARMNAAARHFVGEMDFSAMTPERVVRESMVRRVIRCEVQRHLDEVRIDVEGDGFLYNQVRTMVGTLLNVGRGLWEPDYVAGILQSRDRGMAGDTARPHGLCLQWVRYPAGLLKGVRDNLGGPEVGQVVLPATPGGSPAAGEWQRGRAGGSPGHAGRFTCHRRMAGQRSADAEQRPALRFF